MYSSYAKQPLALCFCQHDNVNTPQAAIKHKYSYAVKQKHF